MKEIHHGAEYSYSYDGKGNLLQAIINGVTKSVIAYDYLGQAVSVTDSKGNTTTQTWNALGKVSKTITPGDGTIASNTTIYQYDLLGNLVYSKDNTGMVTTYTYDSLGCNLSKSVGDEIGNQKITTTSSYDLRGNVLSQTDGNGNTTSYTYDVHDRVLAMTNALGQTTSYTYDANGKQLTETNYLGNTTTKLYDGINRLVEVWDACGNIVQQILYNDADVQTDSYDALHNHIQYLYDMNLRQTGTIDGEGYTSTTVYDSRGNAVKKTDGNGNVTIYHYDGENRLTSVEDSLGSMTCYTYDATGNLLSQTDGNGNTTVYCYNAANLVLSKTFPAGSGNSGKTESYTYYANGLMATKTDRNGITTAYTYDIFGRLLTEDANGEVQSYTYDNNNNLLTMTDATGTTVRIYDTLNRNTSKTVPGIGTSIYAYDNGNRQTITYPDGSTENYSYDGKNQVTSLINNRADATAISWYRYTYDGAGNQLTKQEEKGTTTYTYDELNRLATVTEPSSKINAYTYDGAGNRKTETVQQGLVGSNMVYNYDSQNRLLSTVSTGGEYTSYLYDNNGNTISKTTGTLKSLTEGNTSAEDLPNFELIIRRGTETGTGTGNLILYTYDNYNRLIKVKTSNSTATYQYNAQGYRVEKTVNNKITRYLYQGDKVVLETDAAGNQTAFQAYGSALLYREASGEEYYYLYNAHGDVTALINPDGVIAATYDYDAFGTLTDKTGTVDNHITYAGYQMDDETGLYYLNARYYDSAIARFITEDSYTGQRTDPLTLNLYTYCSNNPIKYTDPTGHWGQLHTTVTEKVAKQEFNKYLEDQVKGDVVYKKDKKGQVIVKNGYKVIDVKNSDADAATWLTNQRKKEEVYIHALVAGNQYVDHETNILKTQKFSSDAIFHGVGKNTNIFTDERFATACSFLTDNITFSNKNIKSNINTYITQAAKTVLTGKDKDGNANTKITQKSINYLETVTVQTKIKDYSPTQYFNDNKTASMFTLGMGLHCIQDNEAHVTGIHDDTVPADDPSYDYDADTGKWYQPKPGEEHKRYNATVSATKDYIGLFLDDYGSDLFTPYSAPNKK